MFKEFQRQCRSRLRAARRRTAQKAADVMSENPAVVSVWGFGSAFEEKPYGHTILSDVDVLVTQIPVRRGVGSDQLHVQLQSALRSRGIRVGGWFGRVDLTVVRDIPDPESATSLDQMVAEGFKKTPLFRR